MISRLRLAVLVGLAAAGLTACDKVPLMAPSESTLTLNTSHTILAPNETAEITATVIEASGTPVQNGTLVLFTTTVGQLDLREARTHNGVATVHLSAGGASGEASVNASSGAAKAAEVLVIKIGTAAAETVTISADPATVPATGGTVTLIATVLDAGGRGLAGLPVSFSADAGTLSATSAVTDATGEARVSLTTFQTSKVSARAGTEVSSTFTVSVRPAVSLTVAATPSVATPAPATFTFTLTPVPSGEVVRNVVLDFGDGRSEQLGTLSGATSRAHLYSDPGTYAVRASGTSVSGDAVTGSTSVVVSTPATGLSVSASPVPVPMGGTATIVVTPAATTTVTSVSLDFGDGSTPLSLGTITAAVSIPHKYAAPGTYTVRVTGVDIIGRPLSATTQVVQNP